MGTAGRQAAEEPILRPRLVRFLKERDRLVDFGFREEFLNELESQVAQRRAPTQLAEKATDAATERARDSAKPVVRDRVRRKMEEANSGVLENL